MTAANSKREKMTSRAKHNSASPDYATLWPYIKPIPTTSGNTVKIP
jgi:hypothetical protein